MYAGLGDVLTVICMTNLLVCTSQCVLILDGLNDCVRQQDNADVPPEA